LSILKEPTHTVCYPKIGCRQILLSEPRIWKNVIDQKSTFVPLHDPAVQNALNILPTFAAMQSPSGGVYYAPNGTVMNQGDQLVDPYEVSVENNFSLYAGLKILSTTLQVVGAHEKDLSTKDREMISEALQLAKAMINGGVIVNNRTTVGLLSFFRNLAWRNGEFVQGGRATSPRSTGRRSDLLKRCKRMSSRYLLRC
jgi:hypothetical protein